MQLREMVERAGRGDHDAFEAVVHASAGRMYAIAYRILRDADLANDALQEALVKVWDDLPALRDPDRFDAWAARITCRCCYRLAKRERRFALPAPAVPGRTPLPSWPTSPTRTRWSEASAACHLNTAPCSSSTTT